ncbi:MAG: YkvA family protein [Kofleriaceae bacterium]
MAKHIDLFKSWSESIVGDVAALKALVESSAELEARRLAAGALGYLVTRMDLVPDWEAGIGALDDVMVLRVCAQLAAGHGLAQVDEAHEITLARMANEAERIAEFLGPESYDKLRAYARKLSDAVVRGRAPATILVDAAARAALFAEVDDEVKKTVPVVVVDPADAELRLKAYLAHKLK